VRVYDLMTRDPVAVNIDTPLQEAARLLVEHRISGVPVVDDEGVVVGVLSESDFVIKERGRDYLPSSSLAWLLGETREIRHEQRIVAARTAGEAMSRPAVTIEGRIASVREAAILMIERRVNRLPVTEDGRLVGIVTRSDLVRVFARSDAELADAVREALRSADGVVVESVEHGVVHLAGVAASEAMAETTIHIAESVDGIVGVEAGALGWTERPTEPIEPVPLA
jgi:CBS domain-containing protein